MVGEYGKVVNEVSVSCGEAPRFSFAVHTVTGVWQCVGTSPSDAARRIARMGGQHHGSVLRAEPIEVWHTNEARRLAGDLAELGVVIVVGGGWLANAETDRATAPGRFDRPTDATLAAERAFRQVTL